MFFVGLLTGLVVAFWVYCIMSKQTKDIKNELRDIRGLLYYNYGIEYDKGSGLFGKVNRK